MLSPKKNSDDYTRLYGEKNYLLLRVLIDFSEYKEFNQHSLHWQEFQLYVIKKNLIFF